MPRLAGLAAAALVALTSAHAAADCDCLWQGSFTEVQQTTDLVISARVIDTQGNSIDLAVDRVLRGDTPATPVRVWLAYPGQCRPEPDLFPQDSQWVMALERIDHDVPGGFNPFTPGVSYGRIGDYALSSCGGYRLRQSGEHVSGNLVEDATRWDHEPEMTPVLLDLVEAFVAGRVDATALKEASREDPALKELMLDTRAFLRNGN